MDWFERLTGFRESEVSDVRSKLAVEGCELVSRVNGRRYGIGELELVSLRELRQRTRLASSTTGHLSVRSVVGDVRRLHQASDFDGALFQVASQFNLLEMVAPHVTPEGGVTRYGSDLTQGPACAIAAGAATIYRNYFAPVGATRNGATQIGQTATCQFDGLADLGHALAAALGRSIGDLWAMRNGYALCTESGLEAISAHLEGLDESGRDALRAHLRIGLHLNVEVTDAAQQPGPFVSQALCSALPVAYGRLPRRLWEGFGRLVLEGAYEATLHAGLLNATRGGSDVVLLTRLGGGAFGNDDAWIDAALQRALAVFRHQPLRVCLVDYGCPHASSMVTDIARPIPTRQRSGSDVAR